MASAYQQQVENIYLAYYGRPADPAGMTYWENQLLNANGNLNTIINAFATSAESTALYGSLTPTAQINAIYTALYGHAADPVGLTYYLQSLASGTFTLGTIALNIFNGTLGADATTLAAKVAYSQAFTNSVQGSTAAILAYTGTTATVNARTAVSNVIDAVTQQAQITSLGTTVAAINVSVPMTPPTSAPSGTTYTLTTGVDHITCRVAATWSTAPFTPLWYRRIRTRQAIRFPVRVPATS